MTIPKAIVTIHPYAPYMDEILAHPAVEAIRLNTVMPLSESYEDALQRLKTRAEAYGKKLWLDLKCRQLRVKTYGIPPFTEIELTHKISVHTPVRAYFSNGEEYATVLKVDGNRLIMQEGPKRMVGPGESVNIPDPSLKIEGFFTETDMNYIEAAKKVGLHDYMLSFIEFAQDIKNLYAIDEKAQVIAKIESVKGMNFVKNMYSDIASTFPKRIRLMAARGDLYIELEKPHHIISALENILKKDDTAVVASRILGSLAEGLEPNCADIGDLDNMMRMGYKHIMLGDDVCMHRDSVMSAIHIFEYMRQKYA